MTELHLIRSEAEYQEYLTRYEGFFDNEPAEGSPEGDEFQMLGLLLAQYELESLPKEEIEPKAVLEMVMEGRGYSQADLGRVLGSRSRASEILRGGRQPSIEHIKAIRSAWGIPADLLIGA